MCDPTEAIRAIARRDQTAFTRLYRAESRSLLVLATGLLAGDRSAAEDVVDAAFMAVWQGAARYQGQSTGQAKAWLRRIVRNKAVDWLRANGNYDLGYDADVGEFDADPAANPELAAIGADAALRLADALSQLSVHQREAVMLCYYEDQPLSQIAEIAQCPEGTVKTRLFHARKALKNVLSGSDGADADKLDKARFS